jgi:phenylpyruvate tautomerase PptA (4-oxalocrotonate tautomerase family)
MTNITVTKALTNFFNVGEGKRPAAQWLKELKALTPEEKAGLAAEVCEVTGDTLNGTLS